MNYEQFSECSIDSLNVKKVSPNKMGAGKSAYVDKEGHKYFSLDKSCKIASIVKPGNTDGQVKQGERFNMEVTITPEEESKANEIDSKFLKVLFDNKTDYFGPSKAKSISSVESIKPMYKYMVREGSDKPDGGKYPNTFRLKIDGWSDYCGDVNVVEKQKEGGEKIKYVKDCTWKNRIVGKDLCPSDSNTTFYLILGENEFGKPKCTDRLPVKDASDNYVLDEKGQNVWRYVGPQDVTWNSEVKLLWCIQKIYVTESTGPTMVANKVYIKPAPKSSSNKSAIESEQLSSEEVLAALASGEQEAAAPAEVSDVEMVTSIEEINSVIKVEPEKTVSGKKRKVSNANVSSDF